MTMNNPVISVIVCTYNQEQTIGRTLEHILAQKTNYSFEIIIGEDASPSDDTRVICEEYAEKYPNIIRLMPKVANKGLVKNYRDCLKVCRGKYVTGCAGDDWWHNLYKLQIQVDFLERNPNFGLVHSDVDFYFPEKGTVIKNYNKSRNIKVPSGDFAKYLLSDILQIYTASVCFRRSLIQNVDMGKIYKDEFLMEDLPLWLELASHSKFYYLDESFSTYTISNGSLCRPNDFSKKIAFIRSIEKVQMYYRSIYYADIVTIDEIASTTNLRLSNLYFKEGLFYDSFSLYKKVKFSFNYKRIIQNLFFAFVIVNMLKRKMKLL